MHVLRMIAGVVALSMFAPLAARTAHAQIPVEIDDMIFAPHRLTLRVGQDYVLRSGESIRDLVVIGGTATIEGNVRGDVTLVFGTLTLSPGAVIDGSLVVVAGTARVAEGATVYQNLLVVGGGIDGPPEFKPGRDHVVVGSTAVLERGKALVPWLTQGLLLGRPIVPQIQWVWLIVFVVFVTSLLLNLIFMDAVRLCAQAIARRPLSTFLVGLLVLLLTGPVAVILAASVIGIAVVPFLLCAVFVAWTLGKVGVAVWIGGSATGMRIPETRLQSVVAFVVGFAAITFVYMVPFLGFVIWGLVGVVGLGAATLAFTGAYRRENPVVPKPHPTPPVPPAGGGLPSDEFVPFEPEPPPSAAYSAAAASVAGVPLPGVTTAPSPAALLLFPRATFLERACAFALDVFLVLIINNAIDLADRNGSVVLLLIAYHIGFWLWKGATVGGIICQIRVVRVTGEPLTFVDGLVRALASVFSIVALGLGCLWILRDPERQAWHDKIAGTYVVKVPRAYPLR